jgi:hypothetical protein
MKWAFIQYAKSRESSLALKRKRRPKAAKVERGLGFVFRSGIAHGHASHA